MPTNDRPLRTIKALYSLFEARWDSLTNLEVGNGTVKLSFGTGAAPVSVVAALPLAQPPISTAPDKPIKEPDLNDADLVLSPPAGMLLPVTEEAN